MKYKILNTCEITNIPQNRERIYIVCFRNESDCNDFEFPSEEVKNIKLKNIIDKDVDESYYYSNKYSVWNTVKEGIVKNISTNTMYQYRRYYVRENKNNVCPTLTANMGSGGHNVPLLKDSKGIRKLTPRECFRLQGFPDTFQLPDVSDSKLYKLAGNAVTVSVVEKIANQIVKLL